MDRYLKYEDFCKEVDKGDLLVGDNAELAKEIARRTPAVTVAPTSKNTIDLPCKVGDTVYAILPKRPCYACKVCADFCHKSCPFDDKTEPVIKKATVYAVCLLEGTNEFYIEIEATKDLVGYNSTHPFSDIGKTIFFVPEEAEKALAALTKEPV